ncbi:MAG: hypothetical protein K2L06_00865 [Alistipes sp.]|nr:hypothetical protein [Alistipes sp.]
MRVRNCISLLLLAVYLLATGGAACLSLSCGCMDNGHVAEHMHAHTHVCCGAELPDAPALSASCTCGRHSTDIQLYTNSHPDDERTMRCAVVFLPAALAAECPCPAHVPALRRKTVDRPAPLLADPLLESAGLRAPPVSA